MWNESHLYIYIKTPCPLPKWIQCYTEPTKYELQKDGKKQELTSCFLLVELSDIATYYHTYHRNPHSSEKSL